MRVLTSYELLSQTRERARTVVSRDLIDIFVVSRDKDSKSVKSQSIILS